MADFDNLPVAARERAGKGASRALRRAGKVPAVIYGDGREPAMVTIEQRLLTMELQKGGFTSKLYELQLDDKKQSVLPRDVQLHPVTDIPLHVDFFRVAAGSQIAIMVTVNFVDEEECDGLRRGGVLNIVRHEVELMCPASAIPEYIEASLKGFDIGDSIHISDIPLPDGVTATITDRDFTIATVASPTVAEEPEDEEGEEGEEGEGEDGVEASDEEGAEGEREE